MSESYEPVNKDNNITVALLTCSCLKISNVL